MAECKTNVVQEKTTSDNTSQTTVQLLRSICPEDISADNLEQTLSKSAELLAWHTLADHCYIFIKDESGNLVDAATGGAIDSDLQITASRALVKKCIAENRCIYVENAMTNDDFEGDPSFQRFNIEKAICTAIKTSDDTYGVIYVDSIRADKLTEDVCEVLEFAGQLMGTAIDGIRKRRLVAAGKAALQLSHSVKNILQMISGASEVIDFGLRTKQIDRVNRSWAILRPNLERMRKFMLDMLDYSKERKLEVGPCEFNRVIQSAIESINSQLKKRKFKLKIDLDQDIPTSTMDSERIHEMTLNLVLNALDAVDESRGLVKIETKYLPKQQSVELCISDNGPGMTEEAKNKAFEAYNSGKNRLSTGLGMPIAKQIIDKHGGRVEIESEPDKGSKFRVILPLKSCSQ